MKFSAEVTPPRPKLDREGIAEAVKELALQLDIEADDIAQCYRMHDDGYELAKNLERHGYYNLDLNAANELDGVSSLVREKEKELQKIWVEAYDVQPPYPDGAKILQGVIDSVCTHEPATYRVKQDGCTQDGRFLLIKFENAFPREMLDAASPTQSMKGSCEYCDDTGDVHSQTGEWRGRCICSADKTKGTE